VAAARLGTSLASCRKPSAESRALRNTLVDSTHSAAKPHDAPAKTPRRNAPELTPSRPPPEKFFGENRSRPNREETSVQEMDAYFAEIKFPVIGLKFPVLQNIFPVNLRTELREKRLQHSGFLHVICLRMPRNRKIPC
jgi:hypothetical protein